MIPFGRNLPKQARWRTTLATVRQKVKKHMITIDGIVLKERSVGEQDKFIDILTKEHGLLEISVKGAKKINGKNSSSTQLFAYSRFCIQQRKNKFYLNSAEPIHIFYNLRASISVIALASYFADILRFSCTEEYSGNGEVMRLFLNCLYYLEKNLRSEAQIKSIFELRLMSEIGYTPDIIGCRECGIYEANELFFDISNGGFICCNCFKEDAESISNFLKIKLPVLNVVRHIVLVDFDRLFNFKLSDSAQAALTQLSENYLLSHLERNFSTLNFYKSLNNGGMI